MAKYLSLFLLLNVNLVFGQTYTGPDKDIQTILTKISSFSSYYMKANYDAMADSYTTDGKIFPGGAPIITGREDIRSRWVMPEGTKILHHQATPEEITIVQDIAYDYGYYEGKTQRQDGTVVSWKGKYVIIWKKVNGDWKMYLDIWNRVND